MSVQDDAIAGQDDDRQPTEKPEPDEDAKQRAAEMMRAYDDQRPTVVLPGSGGAISGTAVNDWLDEDGNPKFDNEVPGGAGLGNEGSDANAEREQIEKDKALNAELIKAAGMENKGEKR
jgi:hypothetical protein